MDKSAIRNFAVNARRKLKEQVEQKAYAFGITKNEIKKPNVHEDIFEVNGNKYEKRVLKHRDSLISKINEKGFEQVIEEVAYTWFNRLIAIRFMEVNEYLTTGVRVLSSTDPNRIEPDVIREALNIDLDLNQDLIYKLQDENKTEELFKYILIKQCNELGKIMPVVFEEIEDYTELLLPDNLLKENSIIRDLVTSIKEDDWKEQVEIIGWLYQYYISEKKDEVFEGLKKNIKITKENIPAATQLFTPDWIVKYMVENSLGRLWLESHPNEELKSKWKYYLEEAEQDEEVKQQLLIIREKNKDLKPEDIKMIDPCMGSGHIICYQFDVLYDIYKSEGYPEREIPRLILENNLYGLDIDCRATQLAYLAIMMKARSYNRRIFREDIELNICAIQESNGIPKEAIDYLVSPNETELEKRIHREEIEYLINVFNDAKEYGSILKIKKVDYEAIEQRIEEIKNGETADIFELQYKNIILEKLPGLIKQARLMGKKYNIVCTNPPYMGSNGMDSKLSVFLKSNYPDSKSDMFAVFMENPYVAKGGYLAMINQHSWMFLSSFSKLREKIIMNQSIYSMIHLGPRAFEEISGEVVQSTAFVLRNITINYKARYIRLIEYKNAEEKRENALRAIKSIWMEDNFSVYPDNFKKINDMPIVYWMSKDFIHMFNNSKIGELAISDGQILTGNNDKYLKLLWEIESNKVGRDKKWVLHAKGGEFRRWSGNINTVVDWSEEARKHYREDKISRIPPDYVLFRKGITWSLVSGDKRFGVRFLSEKMNFNKAAATIFFDDERNIYYFLGYLNSIVAQEILKFINPTINNNIRDIMNMPFIKVDELTEEKVIDIVKQNIIISDEDWNSVETSWDFTVHPIMQYLKLGTQTRISDLFNTWHRRTKEVFQQLKSNEEELNRLFIDIYRLQKELSPNVDDKDITIRKADRVRDIKSLISYAVGCMFGRYSLDEEGLIYAGGEFNSERYKTFKVDNDNVLPILEDEYFEDDIVSRFVEFVKVTFSEETLDENLDFIADTLGKKGAETSRQTIRRYFLKDFYKDHLQTYQKKPIYWLFDSGKNDGFKALIYMHRYDIGNVARVRTDYLHLLQRKYEAEVNRLDMIMESNASTRDKNEARKKKEKIQKQIEECKQYDQVIAHVANQKISIDLDDGVSVNYAKFQGIEVPQGEGRKHLKADLLAKI